VDHDRTVELRAEPGLVGGAEVVAVLEGLLERPVLVGRVEHRGGIVVAQARERAADGLELGGVAADDVKLHGRGS
jgi:hypothetical protein